MTPPNLIGLCLTCGHETDSGVHRVDTMRDGRVVGSTDTRPQDFDIRCEVCGGRTVTLRPPRERPRLLGLVSEIHRSGLTAGQVAALAQAIAAADEATTPADLATQVPGVDRIVTAAAKAGTQWLALLTLALTVFGIWLQHHDAEQANAGADEPPAAHRTSDLSKEDLRKIADEIAAKMEADGAAKNPPEGHP